ncbi:MAG: hypothetical protein R3C62_19345 [Chloroflexota bacterium]
MIDLQTRIDQLQQQMKLLEQELLYLRTLVVAQSTPPDSHPHTFESLRGVWQGAVFHDEDFQESRWQLPEGL